jgi:hypothetical protein
MSTGVRFRVSGITKTGLGTRDSGFGFRKASLRMCGRRNAWLVLVFLLTSDSWLLTSAFAATHVTATYDLGANPRVMATVNGTPQYGLVFAQRNKLVIYGGVEYGPSVVKGYLDASGQLNDGAGNLWLDLIPNLGATPGDSYYVLTFNIQGRVHAEIWVVPDVASVSAEVCRQAQPPSSTAPALFYQFLQQDGDDLPQRQKLNFTGAGVSCVDNAGQLRTDCAISGGGGGGSVPKASATTSGTVKTDATESDPVVYLKSSADSLLAAKAPLAHSHAESDVTNLVADLAAKVPNTRTISTTSPLEGGGALSSNLTLTCATCEVTGHKDAASGYAGLNGSTKLNASQGQEVWSVTDLTSYDGTSGTGSTAVKATFTALAASDLLKWNGSNWVNTASAAKADALTNDPTDCGTNQYATAIAASGDLTCAQPSTSNLSDGTNILKNNQANTYATSGLQDFSPSTLALPAGTTLPPSCAANKEIYVDMDATPAGQQLYLCNATGDGWNLIGDGGGGGGGDNISVNGTAAADADFDDSTPAAPANAINVKWQKDTGTPNNISAYLPYAAPLTVSGGNLTVQAGSGSQNGYISSTDWNTFNGKENALTFNSPLSRSVNTISCPTCITSAVTSLQSQTGNLTFATPGTTGTAPNWSALTLNIPMASASGVTAGLISKTNYDTFTAKPDLVASGSTGIAAYNAGTASTAARSDHTHRVIRAMQWHFPGTVVAGVQTARSLVPEGVSNCALTNSRLTAGTVGSTATTWNIQRCTTAAGDCTATADIYSSNITLNASAQSVAGGTPNTTTATAGDAFRVNLVSVGTNLADVTVALSYTCENTN